MIRQWLSDRTRDLLERVVQHLPQPRVIYDRRGKLPYLSRYYLTASPTTESGGPPFDETGQPVRDVVWPRARVCLHLHKFHRGDEDIELHNHPWQWAISFVLVGGYSEERRVGDEVRRRDVLPFTINLIRAHDFHRVDLLEADAWTLFLTGPKSASWGFWDRVTGLFEPWRDHINKVRGTTDWNKT